MRKIIVHYSSVKTVSEAVKMQHVKAYATAMPYLIKSVTEEQIDLHPFKIIVKSKGM